MADKLYKVGEVIELGYQAPGAQIGKTVRADIYNPSPSKTLVETKTLTEVGSTGTYCGSFTPTVEGTWQVVTYIDLGGGNRDSQVTKSYSVGAKNIQDIYTKVDEIDGEVGSLTAQVGTMDGKVGNIQGEFETGGLVMEIDTKIDDIKDKVSALDTPPMAF